MGTPEQVREKLKTMTENFGADELVIVSITHSFEARCRSYELLADAWNN
jgi:alkanesulfonate monooxygenase SsuD/methylene tetrahydromethanopterin reductase-like flavin-dependent oxidoreductase (luciferase family)